MASSETKGQEMHKLIIFDADGTLRRCTIPGQPCPNNYGQSEIIPGVTERLRELAHADNPPACFIASNQGGVAFGYLSASMALQMLRHMGHALRLNTGLRPWGVHVCFHHPDGTLEPYAIDCACRKPRPGLLYEIMVGVEIGPNDTLYVGDMESDKLAAEAAGVDFEFAKDFFGWEADNDEV